MDFVEPVYKSILQNDIIVMFRTFTNQYLLSPLAKTEFTSHLIESSSSRFITALLIYGGILLTIYEIILHFGVAMNWWNNPADEVFKEIPVHCAHVYISINLLKEEEDDDEDEDENQDSDNRKKPHYLLKYPIVYHFEFSPEEYAHEEYGTDLKFITDKVYKWFLTSEVYHHHKQHVGEITTTNLNFYNKKGKLLKGDDEYLCDLGVETGDTIYCVIRY